MQHIATPKTDAAVSTLPIDLNSTASYESGNSDNYVGNEKNELVFANVLSEAGNRKQISGDSIVDRGKTTPVEPEPTKESSAETESNLNNENEDEDPDIDWVAFVDDVISDAGYTDIIDSESVIGDESNIESEFSSDIELDENSEEDIIASESTTDEILDVNEIATNDEVDEVIITSSEDTVEEEVEDEELHFQVGQDAFIEDSVDELIENDDSDTLNTEEDIILTAASDIVAIISPVDENNTPDLNLEQHEADIELVATLLASELSDAKNKTNLVTDATTPILNLDENKQIDSDLASLSDEDIDAVVRNILTALPESEDKASIAVSLRADIVASVNDAKGLVNSGQSTAQSLANIVEQSLSSDTIELTDEQQSLVLQQTVKAEQFWGLAQNAVEQANGQINVAGQLLNQAATTAHTNDASLASTLDNLTVEGAFDLATQNKAQTQAQAQSLNPIDRPIPIHQAEGQKQIAEKIRWMVGGRVTAAEIRLDPPELGSMQIRINMVGETASVNFVVQSAQARDVLSQAEPQLRDMLSEQGLDLGESFVSTQDGNNSEGENGEDGTKKGLFASEPDDETNVIEQPIRQNQSPYNVDAYV